jgi:hypothetical protein
MLGQLTRRFCLSAGAARHHQPLLVVDKLTLESRHILCTRSAATYLGGVAFVVFSSNQLQIYSLRLWGQPLALSGVQNWLYLSHPSDRHGSTSIR